MTEKEAIKINARTTDEVGVQMFAAGYLEDIKRANILRGALDKIANALPPNALSMVAGGALTQWEKEK